jgi:hypothetical protein
LKLEHGHSVGWRAHAPPRTRRRRICRGAAARMLDAESVMRSRVGAMFLLHALAFLCARRHRTQRVARSRRLAPCPFTHAAVVPIVLADTVIRSRSVLRSHHNKLATGPGRGLCILIMRAVKWGLMSYVHALNFLGQLSVHPKLLAERRRRQDAVQKALTFSMPLPVPHKRGPRHPSSLRCVRVCVCLPKLPGQGDCDFSLNCLPKLTV